MKKYRILYMKCSYTTEVFVRADNEAEAVKKFYEIKGENSKILAVEEVTELAV